MEWLLQIDFGLGPNEITLIFKEFSLVFRAYDEGIAVPRSLSLLAALPFAHHGCSSVSLI